MEHYKSTYEGAEVDAAIAAALAINATLSSALTPINNQLATIGSKLGDLERVANSVGSLYVNNTYTITAGTLSGGTKTFTISDLGMAVGDNLIFRLNCSNGEVNRYRVLTINWKVPTRTNAVYYQPNVTYTIRITNSDFVSASSFGAQVDAADSLVSGTATVEVIVVHRNKIGLAEKLFSLSEELEDVRYSSTEETFIEGYYILTGNAIGETASLRLMSANNYGYAIIDCKEGDVFTLTTYGNTASGKAYTILDENNVILAFQQGNASELQVTIPSGGVKFVTNSYIKGAAPKIVHTISRFGRYEGEFQELHEDVDELNLNVANVAVKDEKGNMLPSPLRMITCPEYLFAIVDADNRFLFGIRREDGTSECYRLVSSTQFLSENKEFMEVHLDKDGKILYGVKKDGTFYMNGIPADTLAALEGLQEYIDERLGGSITLPTSAYLPSYALEDTDIEVPKLEENLTAIDVNTNTEFLAAIGRHNSGENIAILLNSDIALGEPCTISSSSDAELLIEGNGHKIYTEDSGGVYERVGFKNGKAYGVFTGDVKNTSYIADNGDVLALPRTKFYTALSGITDENGNPFSYPDSTAEVAGIRRFRLPDDFIDVSVAETDNVFINFSVCWTAYTCKVTKIETITTGETKEAYIYFQYGGGYNVDWDNQVYKLYTSFFLINYEGKNDSLLIKGGNIYFPSRYRNVSKSSQNIFNISNSNGKVKLCNVNFVGGSINIKNEGSSVIVDSCSFAGSFGDYCISALNGAGTYVTNCTFNNLWGGVIISRENCTLYAVGNKVKDSSLDRTNSYGIDSTGNYYIADNHIEDYGCGAIRVGIISMSTYYECKGIVERNTLVQSREYLADAMHRTVYDSGAIYVAANNNPHGIVRFNKIINYIGRGVNPGIYLDDGAYNVTVLGNVIENNHYRAIFARYATGRDTAGLDDNVNKVILYNVCDESILVGGNPNIAQNGCYVGYNLFTDKCIKDNSFNNLQGQEEQIISNTATITNGIVRLPAELKKWNVN